MNSSKIGNLIYRLRKEKHMTQLELADKLEITDKAVSKWERGISCPDASLLSDLSKIFGVNIENLLSGEIRPNALLTGNMKKTNFYVCPFCKNLVTSLTATNITCCGKILNPLEVKVLKEEIGLNVTCEDNEYYITSEHPMDKDHYISFVALQNEETLIIRKVYPEWDLQIYFPRIPFSRLLWYCSKHGLYTQPLVITEKKNCKS